MLLLLRLVVKCWDEIAWQARVVCRVTQNSLDLGSWSAAPSHHALTMPQHAASRGAKVHESIPHGLGPAASATREDHRPSFMIGWCASAAVESSEPLPMITHRRNFSPRVPPPHRRIYLLLQQQCNPRRSSLRLHMHTTATPPRIYWQLNTLPPSPLISPTRVARLPLFFPLLN